MPSPDAPTIAPTKSELQNILKQKYQINKNISRVLTLQECKQLLNLHSVIEDRSLKKLLLAYHHKNSELSKNNATLGRQRVAERKLAQLQQQYLELERRNNHAEAEQQLDREVQRLRAQIDNLTTNNQQLNERVKRLDTDNQQLIKVNHELMQDNKLLKNYVDALRLRLSREFRLILNLENSEIKLALAKLYKSMLG